MGGAQVKEDDSDKKLEVRKLLPPENNSIRGNILFSINKPKQIEKLLTEFHEKYDYTPIGGIELHQYQWSFTVRFADFVAQIDLI